MWRLATNTKKRTTSFKKKHKQTNSRGLIRLLLDSDKRFSYVMLKNEHIQWTLAAVLTLQVNLFLLPSDFFPFSKIHMVQTWNNVLLLRYTLCSWQSWNGGRWVVVNANNPTISTSSYFCFHNLKDTVISEDEGFLQTSMYTECLGPHSPRCTFMCSIHVVRVRVAAILGAVQYKTISTYTQVNAFTNQKDFLLSLQTTTFWHDITPKKKLILRAKNPVNSAT